MNAATGRVGQGWEERGEGKTTEDVTSVCGSEWEAGASTGAHDGDRAALSRARHVHRVSRARTPTARRAHRAAKRVQYRAHIAIAEIHAHQIRKPEGGGTAMDSLVKLRHEVVGAEGLVEHAQRGRRARMQGAGGRGQLSLHRFHLVVLLSA